MKLLTKEEIKKELDGVDLKEGIDYLFQEVADHVDVIMSRDAMTVIIDRIAVTETALKRIAKGAMSNPAHEVAAIASEALQDDKE